MPLAQPEVVEEGASLTEAAPGTEAAPHTGAFSELPVLLRLGWPNVVNHMTSFGPGVIMLAFLGSDIDGLAAAGMGFMLCNVTGMSLIIGSGAGVGTLVSQAAGAGNHERSGVILQRQLAMHVLLAICIAALWWNTEALLVLLRQPPALSKLTGEFVRWRIPALPFLIVREDLANYLVAQGLVVFPMIVSVIANGLNVLAFPMFIGEFGFAGAPLAMTVANALQAVCLCLFTWRVLPVKEAWPKWRLSTALQGWGEVLSMSLPSAVLMLSEWWGWEMNLIFAGFLCHHGGADDHDEGCMQLDTFPIVSNTMVVASTFHYGFSVAALTHVGNALGAGDAVKARRTAGTAILLSAFLSMITSVVPLLLFRWKWGRLFTNEAEVTELTGQIMPLIAVYIFLDALGPGALTNVLRATGVVKLPAVINFLSFYALGIPVGLILTFGQGEDAGWGIFGLWVGMDLAIFSMVLCLMLFLLCHVDWDHMAMSAQLRSAAPSPVSTEEGDGEAVKEPSGAFDWLFSLIHSPRQGDHPAGARAVKPALFGHHQES